MTNTNSNSSAENFDDFFESSLCGFIITDGEGNITRLNSRVAKWLNNKVDQFQGRRLSDILSIGGKIYFETHLWPLLSMQGYFEEVALELTDSGSGKMPVYINAAITKDESGKPLYINFTLIKASDRRLYEENLQIARRLAETNLNLEQENALIREQFIAVLGHDLRNPLSGIMSAAQLLSRSELGERDTKMVSIIKTSSKRMHEMIDNIMDLARGRLGGGISINPVVVNLEELLHQISDELKVTFPERIIESEFNIKSSVLCDPARMSQLVSNLLANAITHGAANTPVYFKADAEDNFWKISVINQGKPIPKEALKNLFQPFHREDSHSSDNGLGLGLYIASEIAKAHDGRLTVTSDEHKTCFSFEANVTDYDIL